MAMCSKSHNYIQWAPCIIIICLIISNVIPLYAAPIRTVEAVATKISDGDTIQAVTKEGTKIKRTKREFLSFRRSEDESEIFEKNRTGHNLSRRKG